MLLPITQKLKRIIREYYEQSHVNKLGNLDEIDKFLEKQPSKTDSSKNRKPEQTYNKDRGWVSNQKTPPKEKPRPKLVNPKKHLK